ncbi:MULTISPECIES: DUF2269 family protein [unclassified Streptomyces]|uniref:DUF2269 family protein n=1 Tax=Streptomyces johnsoniae TaxID=3075532 RepID=A0ABU2RXT4_9ACTN|nr:MULTISPECIES: DUF2269 family protein [unclassified Streptomyces]MDT0441553.1 DUF2269 family protein [Streptomyces sp. DSM 41886]ONK11397.1 hypothetical protein STBA_21290 [Streptomyces sp. MP131-18]
MTKLLLSVHVLAAILVVGPIAVAASMFPRHAQRSAPGAELLHRICRGYAVVGIAVPVFGIATGAALGVLTDAWLIASLLLTALAAGLLALSILPGQQRLLATPPAEEEPRRATAARLTMLTGMFNLLWAVVVVLMIVRPGSTTSA